MIAFKQFLQEEPAVTKLEWDRSPSIGWWENNDPLRVYHGTQIKHLESIAKTGLDRLDAGTGMISFALEPYTARAFASMGGEADFRKAGAAAKLIPEHQRATLVFELPKAWVAAHRDPDLRGNDPQHLKRLLNKDEYDVFESNDQQYYQLCELRVNAKVPAEFLIGYMTR